MANVHKSTNSDPSAHFCYFLENSNHQPLWKLEAQHYTRIANRSGVFPSSSRVVSIGDVHGDFLAMQRILVDAAQVIKPIDCSLHRSNHSDCPPMCYEWIGGDTTVVVLGDYVHRNRIDSFSYKVEDDNGKPTYYFDGEIKNEEKYIVDLLNYTSVVAWKSETGGRLVKCLGNHEFMDLDPDLSSTEYITPQEMEDFGGEAGRKRACALGGWFHQSLMLCRCYAIVCVGNCLFMHGGLHPDLFEKKSVKKMMHKSEAVAVNSKVDLKGSGKGEQNNTNVSAQNENNNFVKNVNHFLLQVLSKSKSDWTAYENELFEELFFAPTSITWDRSLADSVNNPQESQFNKVLEHIEYNVNPETKIVLGHCVQINRLEDKNPAYRFMQLDKSDPLRYKIHGVACKKDVLDENADMPYYINFDFPEKLNEAEQKKCKKLQQSCCQSCRGFNGNLALNGRVFRIDCAMSRSFDLDNFVSDSIRPAPNPKLAPIIKTLFARQPQCLLMTWNKRKKQYIPTVLMAKQISNRHWLKQVLGDTKSKHVDNMFSVVKEEFVVDKVDKEKTIDKSKTNTNIKQVAVK